MRFIHQFVPAILSAALLIGATGGSALADAAPSPRSAGVRCADGACTVQVGLKGVSPLAKVGAKLGLSALQSRSETLPAGVHLAIDDDLVITLPVGEITLPEAQLDVELGDGNRIARLHGTVETPFPTLGVLNDVRMVEPAIAEVGLDTGRNLSHLGAPLDPDRPYLFFNVSTGFDVGARVAATGESLGLSTPAGQALTLVVDTKEPLVYLVGNVTINHTGEMLLAGPLLDMARKSDLIPDALPMRQRTQVTLSGLAGKNVDERLKLGGSWAVDAGALDSWLGIDAKPLTVEGVLTLSADGMLLDGVVRSSIEPDTVFDGSVHLTAFVPFRRGLADAFVEARADVAIPLAKVATGAGARLDLTDKWTSVQQGAAGGAQAMKDLGNRGSQWLSALPDLTPPAPSVVAASVARRWPAVAEAANKLNPRNKRP
jgi:hypothetical protein